MSETDEPGVCPVKPCVVCANLIPARAQKCTNCNTYQDFRRHLTPISLLLAIADIILLSLIAYATWQDAFTGSRKISPELTYYSFENMRDIQIAVFNDGRIPLYVTHANIYTFIDDQIYGHSINASSNLDKNIRIMPKQEGLINLDLPSMRLIASGYGLKAVKTLSKAQKSALYDETQKSHVGSRLITGTAECGFHISIFRDKEQKNANVLTRVFSTSIDVFFGGAQSDSVDILTRRIGCDYLGPVLLHLYENQAE